MNENGDKLFCSWIQHKIGIHDCMFVCVCVSACMCMCGSVCGCACIACVQDALFDCFVPCSDTDVHTVASLLKLYLRDLPEPVVPWTQYQDFLDCSPMLDPNSAAVGTHIYLNEDLRQILS